MSSGSGNFLGGGRFNTPPARYPQRSSTLSQIDLRAIHHYTTGDIGTQYISVPKTETRGGTRAIANMSPREAVTKGRGDPSSLLGPPRRGCAPPRPRHPVSRGTSADRLILNRVDG